MNTFHLFENTDGTTFVFKEKINSDFIGHSYIHTAVADYDHDGDQDFMASGGDLSESEIYYFRNDNASFIASKIDSFDISVSTVLSMDLTSDEHPELVIYGDNNVYVYKNLGASFAQPVTYAGGGSAMRIKDINGDGVQDIYYKSSTCIRVMLAENEGFASPYTLDCGVVQEAGYYLTDGDMDGDLDIFHGNAVKPGLYWKENSNNDFLPTKQISVTGDQALYISEFDANGDGLQDMLVNSYDYYLGTLERISNTSFGLTHTIASILTNTNIRPFQITPDAGQEISVLYNDWIGYIDPDEDGYQGVKTIYNSSMYIEDVVYADMDQDSDQDLIILFNPEVTSGADSSVIWLQNDNQVFTNPRLVLKNYHDGKSLQVKDFDKDGDLDMAVFSDFVYGKYLENVNGTFEEAQELSGNAWNSRIYDMNGDGWDDILTWDFYSHVLVHINNKNGGFNTVINVNADDDPRNCVAFDFDQDQDMDILVSDWQTGITVYRNNGNSFTKAFNKAIGPDYAGVAAIDLVLDGKTGIFYGTDCTYYRNWGNFNFLTWSHSFFDALYKQLWFADLDLSGSAEMVGYSAEGLFVHREAQKTIDDDGDGFFTDVDCNDFDILVNPGAIEIANNQLDENCDGLVLIIDEDGDGFNSAVDCNDQDDDIHPEAIEIPGNSIDENCDGSDDFGDADGDGYAYDMDCNDSDPDISPGSYDVPLNNIDEDCNGEDAISFFTDRKRLMFDYPVVDVDAVDLNGDGFKEVLYTSHQLIGWIGYEIPGGSPLGYVKIDNEADFTHAEAGDFDNDGDMDVVGASDFRKTISLFMNDGQGNFGTGVSVDTFATATAMDIGDVDGDGYLDIAAAFYGGSSHKPSIYFGDGTGQFVEIKPISDNATLGAMIYIYDIDDDKDLDLFISSYLIGMGWYENLGNRLFSTRKSICNDCPYPGDLFHVDYDHDGKQELVYYISGVDYELELFPGIQVFDYHDGNITYRHHIAQHDVLGRIYPQDMNGDCTLDFVWGGVNYLTMGIAYNFGQVPFPEHRMRDTSLRILDIIAEDLNGDGNPEMILGTTNQNTVTIIRNDFPSQDTDGDGDDQMEDCAYCDPNIHSGASEIPNNGIDENCDGLDIITGFDNTSRSKVILYPNPTDGKIYMELDNQDQYNVTVYNSLGSVVVKDIRAPLFDLTGRPEGIYFLVLEEKISGDRISRRIVLQQ